MGASLLALAKSICTAMQGYVSNARLNTGMYGYEWLSTAMHGCARLCTAMHGFVRLRTAIYGYVGLCAAM